MSENDNHIWRSLGNIEAKIDTILSVQAGIFKDGCALGQEHTRQITAILSKNGNGNGAKKSNGGFNWIEVTKNGIRAGGITSLMMAVLLWLAWSQYHNNARATISEDRIAAVVQKQIHGMERDNIKLLANGESTKQEFQKQTASRAASENRIIDKVEEQKK